MPLITYYITNNLDVARAAEQAGVDRIWVDLETIGKEERQKNFDSVKSKHSIEDVQKISQILTKSKMMVRINPWNENSCKEIDDVVVAGGEYIMLPMWKTKQEVEKFILAVNGRAKTMLLLETREADECLIEVLRVDILALFWV